MYSFSGLSEINNFLLIKIEFNFVVIEWRKVLNEQTMQIFTRFLKISLMEFKKVSILLVFDKITETIGPF